MQGTILETELINENALGVIEYYLKEIRKYPRIHPIIEKKLIIKAKKGCKESLDKILKSNLKFVLSVAYHYINNGVNVPLADLINVGNMGILKAVKKFNCNKKNAFISYAVWWIRSGMIIEILDHESAVRIPRSIKKDRNRVDSMSFYKDYLGSCSYSHIEEDIDERENKKRVAYLIKCLSRQERKVISLYYNLEEKGKMTFNNIGRKIGLTKQRANDIKDTAMIKMKKRSNAEIYKSYFE